MGRRKKSARSSDASKKREVKTSFSVDNATTVAGVDEKLEKTKNTGSSRLLDVYARLSLPLLKLNENNLLTDSDDEETLEFEIRPRFVFSCCMCLVCTNVSDCRLTCEKCKMVSYCTLEHLEANRSSHGALCNALSQRFKGNEMFRGAKETSADDYRSMRIKRIEEVEATMKRRLDLWEQEIILYPRVCRTCRNTNEADLVRCPNCESDFYCEKHSEDHEKWCKDFRVFRRVLWMQHKHGYAVPNFPDVVKKQWRPLANNFDQLLLEMFDSNFNYRRIDAYTYAIMSLSASSPLTALSALEKTRSDLAEVKILKIDIVGAEFHFECSSLRAWEKLFVHHLPNLRKLYLRFIGPELTLPDAPRDLLSRVVLCRRCKKDKRRIIVEFNEGKLYHEIVETPGDLPADLICLFNPGLYRHTGYDGSDTWPRTIDKFCRAKVPVVVTAYTEFEIPRDIERIQSLGKIEILMEPKRNPFASVKPDRNFVSDDILPLMYKNYCVSIVRGL